MLYAMSTQFGEYLKQQIAARRKSEGRVWTQNELARRAGLSGGHASMIINGLVEPDAKTLKSLARALKVAPEEVFTAAGVLPGVEGEVSGEVLELARALDALPESVKGHAIITTRSLLRGLYAAAGERITEGYTVLSDREYLAAIIRQFRDADPEGYEEFAAALLADDEKTPPEPGTSGGEGQAPE